MGSKDQGGANPLSLGGPREPKTTITVTVKPTKSGDETTITITVEPSSLGGDRQPGTK